MADNLDRLAGEEGIICPLCGEVLTRGHRSRPIENGSIRIPENFNFRSNSLSFLFREIRASKGITKKSIAEKLGVSEEYISQVEQGTKRLPLRCWLLICEEFGMNPQWLKKKWLSETLSRMGEKLEERIG